MTDRRLTERVQLAIGSVLGGNTSDVWRAAEAALEVVQPELDALAQIEQLLVDFPDPEAGPLPGELRQALQAREAVKRGMDQLEESERARRLYLDPMDDAPDDERSET